jgi:hypothetical protein
MTQITKDEYVKRLKEFINTQMANVQADGTRHDLRFWVKFNQDKEVEFKNYLQTEGITVVGQ